MPLWADAWLSNNHQIRYKLPQGALPGKSMFWKMILEARALRPQGFHQIAVK